MKGRMEKQHRSPISGAQDLCDSAWVASQSPDQWGYNLGEGKGEHLRARMHVEFPI